MANWKTCDRCGKPIARNVKPYRVDVSNGMRARDVFEQSKCRIHCEVCFDCAGKVVAFIRRGEQ